MAESGFNWYGAAAAGTSGVTSNPDAAASLTHTGRKLTKLTYKQERQAIRNQLASIREERAFREKEDPREQAALNQSMFGRGLGKSTIAEQDKERLSGIQARRLAELGRSEEMGQRALKILKTRRNLAKRQKWIALATMAWSTALGGMNVSGGGGGGASQAGTGSSPGGAGSSGSVGSSVGAGASAGAGGT